MTFELRQHLIHVTHHLNAFYLFTAGFISYDTIAIEMPQ